MKSEKRNVRIPIDFQKLLLQRYSVEGVSKSVRFALEKWTLKYVLFGKRIDLEEEEAERRRELEFLTISWL